MNDTPYILNISRGEVSRFSPEPNSVLIQITDPGSDFPPFKNDWEDVYQFEFLDAEDDDDYIDEAKISDSDAATIVGILKDALKHKMNVVVHCNMGFCRSGAVVEVGVIMGFRDTGRFRSPNLRVKTKMMRVLGMSY